MSNNSSSNRAVVPEAKGALDRFKFEVANELGVPLTDGYNGTADGFRFSELRNVISGRQRDNAGDENTNAPLR